MQVGMVLEKEQVFYILQTTGSRLAVIPTEAGEKDSSKPAPVAQLMKTQRQKFEFNLKVRKTKQPATGSYQSEMEILPPRISECMRAVSSRLIFLS